MRGGEAAGTVRIRDFAPGDGPAVAAVVHDAFEEFRDRYDDYDALSAGVGPMRELAATGEMIVATADGRVVGAVTYVGPGRPKKEVFPAAWPILRMLVVSPAHRGGGIGRALVRECIRRARRDGAPLIALHTAAIMKAAVALYEDLGFRCHGEAPPEFGVPHAVYVKPLDEGDGA